MTPVDLEPAAQRLADLVGGVPDELLDAPTPCPAYTMGDLVEHIGGAASAFAGAAVKDTGDATSQGPSGDASRLSDDWRTRIPSDLAALADAWRDPDAWSGMTKAGGVDLPGEVAGLVAVDELVVHGWDIARASGQRYDCEAELVEAAAAFVRPMAESGEAPREGLFGPPVPVPPDASPL